MASDSSFDIVSKVDPMEAKNAVDQAQREIAQRYDFKGVGAEIAWSGEERLLLKASTEDRVKAVLEVLESKFVKRGISSRALDTHRGGPEERDRLGRREDDLQDHPRRGTQVRQVADPG